MMAMRIANKATEFLDKGWTMFAPSPAMTAWIDHVRPVAAAVARDPQHAKWHRHGGTWFVGVNALPNDATGAVDGGPPLAGDAVELVTDLMAPRPMRWDRGQVSICCPGYPQPSATESAAAHRFRRERDAAHVDGLMAQGPGRRRYIREYHQFLLGIPMAAVRPGMSPFVVWEGSHHIMRRAFSAALDGVAPAHWHDIDVTETYTQARRNVFDSCRRVELCTEPGWTYVMHRLALHGMAPWTAPQGPPRAIVYFRPEMNDRAAWLSMQ